MDLLVAELDKNVDELLLNKLFSAFGEVQRIKIVRDDKTKISKGFGFITMETEAAENAMKELNGKIIAGKEIVVKLSTNKAVRKRKRIKRQIYSTNKKK